MWCVPLQGLPLGADYFYAMNPDFLLQVVNDLLKFGPEKVNHACGLIILNPLHAKYFRGNINIYLHFVSFLNIDMTQVLKILLQAREGPRYSIYSVINIMAADVLAT